MMRSAETNRIRSEGSPNCSPFWSVMIPVYEPDKDHLYQAIETVLKGTEDEGPVQIEVVDDSSPRVDVRSLVDCFGKGKVSYFKTHRNLGLAGGWNTCIERAKGEWIHLLHQDDCVDERFYTSLRKLISGLDSAAMAFCRNNYIDSYGKIVGGQPVLQPRAGFLHGGVDLLAMRNWISCPAVVVKRAAYEYAGRYNPAYTYALDWEMWLRLASRYPIIYSPEILASFRVQGESETSRLMRTGETVRDSMKLIKRFGLYVSSDKIRHTQESARNWIISHAILKAEQFLKSGHSYWALSQIRAVLAVDFRFTTWVRIIKLIAKTALSAR
jgi:glycosyltransferase involved in cell wall biosynthesis